MQMKMSEVVFVGGGRAVSRILLNINTYSYVEIKRVVEKVLDKIRRGSPNFTNDEE